VGAPWWAGTSRVARGGARAGGLPRRGRPPAAAASSRALFLQSAYKCAFAGLRDPPRSPPARSPRSTQAGGYTRREQARPAAGAQLRLPGGPAGFPALRPRPAPGRRSGRQLASPFFAERIQMSFAGLRDPPRSPPARAPRSTQAGGYTRERGKKLLRGGCRGSPWHLSAAAFAGSYWSHFILRRSRVVPYGLPGYRRLRRAPPQHRCCPGAPARPSAASGKTPLGAREYPVCAEGWAMWVLGGSPHLFQSHRGYLPAGEASGLNLPARASSWGA
jgi:hypothetical protein